MVQKRHAKTTGCFQEAAVELRGTALQPCLELLRSKEEEDRQVPFRRFGGGTCDTGFLEFSGRGFV